MRHGRIPERARPDPEAGPPGHDSIHWPVVEKRHERGQEAVKTVENAQFTQCKCAF